jgi:hypothetical protein
MFRRTCLLLIAAVAILGGGSGCGSDPNGPGTGTVRVFLTDAPTDIDAVNLVVDEVSVRRVGDDEDEGWEVIRTDDFTVDLLTLRNGVFADFAEGTVPAGTYDEIRLKLTDGSNLVVDGETHPLTVPSGMSSGYKIKGPFEVPDGGEVVVLLDFEAEQSIHQTGNGRYMLHPVVRLMVGESAGSIGGTVSPADVVTEVFALANGDTAARTVTGQDGSFVLSLLGAGSYDVRFDPPAGWRDTTRAGIGVTAGERTDIGTTELTPE